MNCEIDSLEEAQTFVDNLAQEKKWAISVLSTEKNTYIVQWVEHKKYTMPDGREEFDEVWIGPDGSPQMVQDLSPEQAKTVLRQFIMDRRRADSRIYDLMDKLEGNEDMFGDLLDGEVTDTVINTSTGKVLH